MVERICTSVFNGLADDGEGARANRVLFITLTLSGQDRMYKVYIQPEGEERLDINSNSASILLNHYDGDQYFYHNTLNSSMFPQWLRNSSPSLAQLILANKKHPTRFFGRLSIDIIVISILPLLCAEDIISLRRVNKLLFALTHERLVWKGILGGITSVPLPPILDLKNPEREVTRAISVDDNFRGEGTRIFGSTSFSVQNLNVLDTKILLGGKHLVLSVARPAFRPTSRRKYGLVITQLDSDEQMFASTVLESRAYSLDSKYMTFNGHKGIMISFVRRTWALRYGPDLPTGPSDEPLDRQPCVDLDDVGYDVLDEEETYPQEFELVCKFIPIDELEAALNPNADYTMENMDIFKHVAQHSLQQIRIWDPVLFELDGSPHVGFVTQPKHTKDDQPPDGVSVMRIDGPDGPAISFSIYPNRVQNLNTPHRIHRIRVLPKQRQILMVRIARTQPEPEVNLHMFELYNFLAQGTTAAVAAAGTPTRIPHHGSVTDYQISDHYRPSIFPAFNPPPASPPPISMYVTIRRPAEQEMHHFTIWPSEVIMVDEDVDGVPAVKWEYKLSESSNGEHNKMMVGPTNINLHLVPAVHRCLLWRSPLEDHSGSPKPLLFERYVSEDRISMASLCSVDSQRTPEPVLVKGRKAFPDNAMGPIVNLADEIHLCKNGISSITWDETIGRACYVSGESDRVTVLDFCSPGWWGASV